MLKKTKRNVFATLSFLFALSMATAGGAMTTQNVVKAEEADAAMLQMTNGGYIRLGWDEGENGEIVTNGDTGIMFQATASTALATALENDANATVGMMIVPQKVITAYNNQKEEGESDYFKYIVSKVPDATEDKIAATFAASQLSKTEETKLKVSIADLEDVNYNESYQAVAYYKTNGTYYYSAQSEVRTVAQMADAALKAGNLNETEIKAAASVIEKAIELKDFTVTVDTHSTVNLKEALAGYVTADDITFTSEDSKYMPIAEGVATASAVGTWKVNVEAYDGAVDFDINVTMNDKRSDTLVMLKNAEMINTYGTTTPTLTANSFNDKWNSLDPITLLPGTAEGEKLTNVKSTHLSYISLNRISTASSAVDHASAAFCIAIDFTGNNMPMVSYFVDNNDGTENIVEKKGVLMTNGFKLKNHSLATFSNRYTAYGFKQLTNNTQDTDDDTGATVGEIDARLGIYQAKDENGNSIPVPCSYNALQDGVKYRYFLRAEFNSTFTKISVAMELYTINEDGSNGTKVDSCTLSKNVTPLAGTDYYRGNIVIYGRPYEETKLDRVYLPLAQKMTTYQGYTPFKAAA